MDNLTRHLQSIHVTPRQDMSEGRCPTENAMTDDACLGWRGPLVPQTADLTRPQPRRWICRLRRSCSGQLCLNKMMRLPPFTNGGAQSGRRIAKLELKLRQLLAGGFHPGLSRLFVLGLALLPMGGGFVQTFLGRVQHALH